MGDDLRFAVVGSGGIGHLHARTLGLVDGARLVGVADADQAQAARLARAVDVPVLDVETALTGEGVDAVAICTPSGSHASLAERAATAGRHVLVEKPVDVSPAAAERLIAATATSGVTLGVVSQHRFDDSMTRLHGAAQAGRLGKLIFAAATVRWWREQSYYDGSAWRGTTALDGGALLNQGVHHVDLLLWLLGPAQRVYARQATAAHRIEAPDLDLLTIDFVSGALATLEVTTAAYPGFPETLSVTGTNGTVLIEGSDVATWGIRGEEQAGAVAPPATGAAADPLNLGAESHRRQYVDFVGAVRSGRPPAVTGDDGLAALRLITAANRSADTGAAVDILPLAVPA